MGECQDSLIGGPGVKNPKPLRGKNFLALEVLDQGPEPGQGKTQLGEVEHIMRERTPSFGEAELLLISLGKDTVIKEGL